MGRSLGAGAREENLVSQPHTPQTPMSRSATRISTIPGGGPVLFIVLVEQLWIHHSVATEYGTEVSRRRVSLGDGA